MDLLEELQMAMTLTSDLYCKTLYFNKNYPDVTPTKTDNQLTIHIIKGSSNQGIGNYIDVGSSFKGYFSQDRIQ